MAIRRLASASLVAVLVALVGATASAQFGNILKKAPKPPTPGATPTAAASKTLECSQIDDNLVNKAVEGSQNAKKASDAELAKANAKKAEATAKKAQADGLRQKSAQLTVSNMMENGECKDKAKEKDPRMKEARRLEDLLAAANDRGDEAKAAEISKKLDPLNEAIDLDADRACGGKGSAALHDCMERKTAELSKQGLAGPMLQIQAQGACMSDPSTNGIAGMAGPTAEEQALDAEYERLMAEYQEIMRALNEKADKARRDAMGLDDREYARFSECVVGVLRKDPDVLSVTSQAGQDAIRRHAAQLRDIQ